MLVSTFDLMALKMSGSIAMQYVAKCMWTPF